MARANKPTPQSVFASLKREQYVEYAVQIYLHKIVGGAPGNPKVLASWIQSKLGKDAPSARKNHLVRQTLLDLHPGIADELQGMSDEEVVANLKQLSEKVAERSHTTVFKRLNGTPDSPPVIEGRQVKSGLKEAGSVALNDLHLGGYKNLSGKTVSRRRPRTHLAEVLFVPEDKIPLWADEAMTVPAEVETESRPIHVDDGFGGKNTSLKSSEIVREAYAAFTIRVLGVAHEELEPLLPKIMLQLEEGGLGADRSQSFGRFETTKFERI